MKTSAFVALVPALIGGVLFLFASSSWALGTVLVTVGQEDWSLLFTVGGLLFSGVSATLFLRGQTRKTLLATARSVAPLVPVGILLAFATGWITTGYWVNPGGIIANNGGFPFTWKVDLSSCPRPCIQANGTIYNPLFFALDSLFFIVVGYAVLHEYVSRRKVISSPSEARS